MERVGIITSFLEMEMSLHNPLPGPVPIQQPIELFSFPALQADHLVFGWLQFPFLQVLRHAVPERPTQVRLDLRTAEDVLDLVARLFGMDFGLVDGSRW